MDELELLRRHRPDPRPTPTVVDDHRAQLRAALGGAPVEVDAPRGDDALVDLPAPRTSPPRRVRVLLTAAAAAMAVGALAFGISTRAGDGADQVAAVTTAPAVAPPSGSCGPLPFELPTVEGFSEVRTGPSGDNDRPPTADQLVLHQASTTGSIEVRWPYDDPNRVADNDRVSDDDRETGMSGTIGSEPQPTATGRQAVRFEIHDPALSGDPACRWMGFVVADVDPTVARTVGSRVFTALGAPGGPFGSPVVELVTGEEAADELPAVPPCQAPAGVDHVDRVGGPVELGTYPTPSDALEAFIESMYVDDIGPFGLPERRATVAERGYVALQLPDGTIGYLHRLEAGATIVHAVAVDGGWTIDRWEATGC